MPEYIEREAVLERLKQECSPVVFAYLADLVNAIPAADVRPVVRGKWEWNDNNGYYYCGNCKAVSPREDQDGEYIDCPNVCPNCGADMRETNDEKA